MNAILKLIRMLFNFFVHRKKKWIVVRGGCERIVCLASSSKKEKIEGVKRAACVWKGSRSINWDRVVISALGENREEARSKLVDAECDVTRPPLPPLLLLSGDCARGVSFSNSEEKIFLKIPGTLGDRARTSTAVPPRTGQAEATGQWRTGRAGNHLQD